MPGDLKDGILRDLEPNELVAHLRSALHDGHTTAAISQHLLQSVATDSLSPQCYTLWLSACPDPVAIRIGLEQTCSIWIRSAALKAFKRWFERPRCSSVWEAVGGTDGLTALMAAWSVDEVKTFCGFVRMSAGKRRARGERQRFVTELVMALLDGHFPESKLQNPDRRPLMPHYVEMVYACTPEFADTCMGREDLPKLNFAKVVHAHASLYRKRCLDAIGSGETDLKKYLPLFEGALPETPQKTPGVTTTMAFHLEVVDVMLEQAKKTGYDLSREGPKTIMAKLLKIATKRRSPPSYSTGTISSLGACMRSSKHRGRPIILACKDIEYGVLRLWRTNMADSLLDDLLLLTGARSKFTPSNVLYDYINEVPKSLRYDLMRWLLLRAEPKQVDIDKVLDLRVWTLKHAWWPSLFQNVLPRDQGQRLFTKLCDALPDGSFLRTTSPGGGTETGMALVSLSLRDDADGVARDASQQMHAFMEKAQGSREQLQRAENAKLAILFAAASRSLDVLSEALLWARRYNRDPLTTMDLYRDDAIWDGNVIGLMSGLPANPSSKDTLSDVAGSVRQGNDIVMLLLETATMCQLEPGFQSYHWSRVKSLFGHVVRARLERADSFQSALHLDNETVYSAIWASTVEALIKAEELGLHEDNKKLALNDVGGPLLAHGCMKVKEPSLASLRFMEDLMKQRDALWQRHRPTVHPAVMTLEVPWPRGLAVQALNTAFDIEAKSGFTLPYLENRVEKVVFADPRNALKPLPEDDESLAAIGCFVENYNAALRLYTGWGDVHDGSRAKKAWAHAIGPLSEGRMSELEAKLYWKVKFANAGVTVEDDMAPLPTREGPSTYFVGSSENVVEWNPDTSPDTLVSKRRTLKPTTCIDCFVNCRTPFIGSGIDTPFNASLQSVVPEHCLPAFWDLDHYGRHIPAAAREDYIAAALLYVEGSANASSKILGSFFPSVADARFPAMFLDQDFLDRRDFTMQAVEEALWKLRTHIPPFLLLDLVEGLMERFVLERKRSPALQHWTFAMLKLLAWSDRPELAVEVITAIVVGMPEESSWHRELLHPGVLNRLPGPCAQRLMTELKDAMLSKLNPQARWGDEKGEAVPEPMELTGGWRQVLQGKRVKLTTTKMLAQMMNGAAFIDERFSVQVLVALFEKSTHHDTRIPVVQSLTSILATTRDDTLKYFILDALEAHALPVAQNINERKLITEQDWLEAEEKGEPPEVYEDGPYVAELPPVCEALCKAVTNTPAITSADLIDQLLTRLVFPIIQASIQNYTRWTAILLRAHGAQHLAGLLPSIPIIPQLLIELLQSHPARMPASLFRMLSDYTLTRKFPPPGLEAVKYRQYSTRTPAKTFWLRLWATPLHFSLLSQCQLPLRLPEAGSAPDGTPRLDFDLLMSHEWEVVDRMLANYTQHFDDWKRYVMKFGPKNTRTTEEQDQWDQYSRLVVEYAVGRILQLRADPKWRDDPARKPAVLPDDFPLRVDLMAWPIVCACDDEAEVERRRERFAQDVSGFIEELVHTTRPYIRNYACLPPVTRKLPMKAWPQLAFRVGRMASSDSGEISATTIQKAEFADGLLQDCDWSSLKKEQRVVWEGCQEMVEDWKGCQDEGLRRMGWKRSQEMSEASQEG